jgi:hypothetical protein
MDLAVDLRKSVFADHNDLKRHLRTAHGPASEQPRATLRQLILKILHQLMIKTTDKSRL